MASLFKPLFSFLPKLTFLRRWISFLRLHLLGPAAVSEPLPLHLQYMKEDADIVHARWPMDDHFCPSFTSSDGPVVATQIMRHISYYFTTNVFVKRQPHVDDLGLTIYGTPAVSPYVANRLRNEAAALQFISKHTSIPVPEFLDLWEENGLVYLKTRLVRDGIELCRVDASLLDTAVAKVGAQLESEIIPELQKLRRNFIGSADPTLPVVVPRRHWTSAKTEVWPKVTSETDEFVFVHSDLDRQNILVDPHTFRIVSIIDWETAGFFPPSWELHLWTEPDNVKKHGMLMAAKKRELPLFDPGFTDD